MLTELEKPAFEDILFEYHDISAKHKWTLAWTGHSE